MSVNEIFVIGGSSLYESSFGQYKDFCKLVIATRINKKYECDTFIPNLETSADFSPLFVSQTYSQDDITYDYCFLGNTGLLSEKPELIPTKLMEKYPKHQEF